MKNVAVLFLSLAASLGAACDSLRALLQRRPF
jgi:hypothetical protein